MSVLGRRIIIQNIFILQTNIKIPYYIKNSVGRFEKPQDVGHALISIFSKPSSSYGIYSVDSSHMTSLDDILTSLGPCTIPTISTHAFN